MEYVQMFLCQFFLLRNAKLGIKFNITTKADLPPKF